MTITLEYILICSKNIWCDSKSEKHIKKEVGMTIGEGRGDGGEGGAEFGRWGMGRGFVEIMPLMPEHFTRFNAITDMHIKHQVIHVLLEMFVGNASLVLPIT